MGYKPLGLPTAHRLLALLQQVARDVERQMGGETTEGQEVADCCDGKEDSKRNSSASGDSDSGSGSGGGGGCDGGSGNSGVCHPVHLFGFSKGGVVLNQLLAEAAEVGQMLTAQVPYSERLGKTEDRLGKIDSLSKIPPPALAVPASIAAAQAPAAAAAAAAAAAPAAAAAAADSPPPFSLPGSPMAFLQQAAAWEYVDVGLNCRGAYPTDPRTLSAFVHACQLRPALCQHGSYLWKNKQRNRPQGQIKRNADAAPPSLRHHMTKRQRNAITAKEKLHWLKMQDSQPDLSNRALAKLAKVQPCQIREWKKMKERLEVASSCRRRLMGHGRKSKYPFMERAVYRHFLKHRAKGLAVTVSMLQKWSAKYMKHRMPGVNWRASFREVEVLDDVNDLVDDETVINPFYAEVPMPAEELQAAAHEEDATEEDAEAAAAEEEGVVLEEGGEAEEPSDDEWWRPGRYDREQCDEWHAGYDSE
ncbi:unnamed protein product [Closterium sp. NIES-65]|nr:unnamed protein product [Closterium sp. NIES-65]